MSHPARMEAIARVSRPRNETPDRRIERLNYPMRAGWRSTSSPVTVPRGERVDGGGALLSSD